MTLGKKRAMVIEYELNEIRQKLDKYDLKMEEAEGDTERIERLKKLENYLFGELDGMNTILRYMGYELIQGKDGEPWSIRKRKMPE